LRFGDWIGLELKCALSTAPQDTGFHPHATVLHLLIAHDVFSEPLWEQFQAQEITIASLPLFDPADLCKNVTTLDVATAGTLIEAAKAYLAQESLPCQCLACQ
jgi:hypothetical protein